MQAYYNENDSRAAEWLRHLMWDGAIPWGYVDERSIEDVKPDDLEGYSQHHFFAGIGGWPLALRLAGWPDDRPVWTGSCPCQPFSVAGQGKGVADERHLWPSFRWLAAQCKPPVIFGEQVASKAGRSWLAGVQIDLEALGYRVGSADLCAAGVGAPHIRQRLYWMADRETDGRQQERADGSGCLERSEAQGRAAGSGLCCASGGLADTDDAATQGRRVLSERTGERAPWTSSLDCWLPCADGKARRIEPGLEPLAHGIPGRVGLLRGYGNAIVPGLGATFIESYLDL